MLPSIWMPTDHIVSLLIAERDKLNRAIEDRPRGCKAPGPSSEMRGDSMRKNRGNQMPKLRL